MSHTATGFIGLSKSRLSPIYCHDGASIKDLAGTPSSQLNLLHSSLNDPNVEYPNSIDMLHQIVEALQAGTYSSFDAFPESYMVLANEGEDLGINRIDHGRQNSPRIEIDHHHELESPLPSLIKHAFH